MWQRFLPHQWPVWLTERDNQTPCIVRIGWFIVFFALLFNSIWSAYKGVNFDFGQQAHAWVEFLGAASIAIAAKAMTEPKPGQANPQAPADSTDTPAS